MRYLNYFFILIFILVVNPQCFSQEQFTVRNVPMNIRNQYLKHLDLPQAVKDKAFYLEKWLKPNTSEKDLTQLVQKAIDQNNVIVFPNYTIKINKEGLKIPSDRILYFQKKSKLVFEGPADTRDSDILKLYNVKNVSIYNPQIVGSKFADKKQWGEWSAGIAILGCENILVYNAQISDTYGDGIIIGNQSKNITIKGGFINQARRDGISVTSGIQVNISDMVIANTTGTLPMCGIQIEPDFIEDYLKDIRIKNIIGYNNNNATLNMNLGVYSKAEKPAKQPEITITVENITDYYSNYAFGMVLNADKLPFTPKGKIIFRNIKSVKSNHFVWKDGGKTDLQIISEKLYDRDNIKVDLP